MGDVQHGMRHPPAAAVRARLQCTCSQPTGVCRCCTPALQRDPGELAPRLQAHSQRLQPDPLPATQVQEVTAFASVHDMIHNAILACGSTASLREVR